MRAINFHGVTTTYTAPEGWDEERDGPCHDLPVMVDQKSRECTTLWRPTEHELELLRNGHPVLVNILGGQPPISVGVAVTYSELPMATVRGSGRA